MYYSRCFTLSVACESLRDVLPGVLVPAGVTLRDRFWSDGRVTRGGRGSFLDFVRTQEDTPAATASIEDVTEHAARADALVSAVLGRVMRQRRSIAAALDYVKALSPGTRANCWDLAEAAGHDGPHRMQALLRSCRWPWEKLREALPALAAQCLPDDPDDLIGPGLAIGETAHLKKGALRRACLPSMRASQARWKTA